VSQSVTECLRVSQSVSECHRVAQSGTEWHRVAQSGTEWHRVSQLITKSFVYLLAFKYFYRFCGGIIWVFPSFYLPSLLLCVRVYFYVCKFTFMCTWCVWVVFSVEVVIWRFFAGLSGSASQFLQIVRSYRPVSVYRCRQIYFSYCDREKLFSILACGVENGILSQVVEAVVFVLGPLTKFCNSGSMSSINCHWVFPLG
jgi:hypothetical protein